MVSGATDLRLAIYCLLCPMKTFCKTYPSMGPNNPRGHRDRARPCDEVLVAADSIRVRGVMKVIEVAAGIIAHEGRYLIARRKAGAHLGGFWEFPAESGKPEKPREMFAPGIVGRAEHSYRAPTPFQIVRHEYPEKVVGCIFLLPDRDGTAVALDCAEVRWVSPDEMATFEFPPADQPVIAALRAGRRNSR